MPVGKPPQSIRVLRMLRNQPAVCSVTLLQAYIPRAAAVIHRLRRDGWDIRTEPCADMFHHHDTPQVQYVLVSEPTELAE